MSSTAINYLNYPTINGLNSLSLDELFATSFQSGTVNADITYIKRIETNEIIVDTKLTLTPTGVISVGSSTISDVELTYLDGVTSNIQTQINAATVSTTGLQTQITNNANNITTLQTSDASQNALLSTHTTNITALQGSVSSLQSSDTAQNYAILGQTNSITSLQTTVNAHTTSINNLQTTVNAHTTSINNLNTSIYDIDIDINALQTSDASQNTRLTSIESINTTQNTNITALQTSDVSQNTRLTNIETLNTTQNTNITALQTSDATQNTRLNNIESINTTQNTNITALQTSDATQNTSIATAMNRVRNMTATSALTSMSKPLIFNTDGECIKMSGTNTNIAGYDSAAGTRDFALGNASTANKKINLIVDKQDSLNFISGTNASNLKGRNDINTYSNGIRLYRGWVDAGNFQEYSGAIGQLNSTLPHFFITSNGTNPIYIDSGISSISLVSNTVWLGSPSLSAGNGYRSNINFLTPQNEWQTQSQAFTDILKQQVIDSTINCTALRSDVNAAIEDITRITDRLSLSHIKINLGLNLINMSSLANNTTYSLGLYYDFNVGQYMYNNGYSSMFYSDGTCRFSQDYLLQFSNVFYHNYSLITNFQSQIQVVHTATGNLWDNSQLLGLSSNGAAGNFTTQMSQFNYTTDFVPIKGSNLYGTSKIFIRTAYNFKTANAPFNMIGYFRFIQHTHSIY